MSNRQGSNGSSGRPSQAAKSTDKRKSDKPTSGKTNEDKLVVSRNIWLYFKHVDKQKTIAENPNLKATDLAEELQVQLQGPPQVISELKKLTEKYMSVVCQTYPVPSSSNSQAVQQLIKNQCKELSAKVYTRVTGDCKYLEFIGKKEDIDKLSVELNKLTSSSKKDQIAASAADKLVSSALKEENETLGEFKTTRSRIEVRVICGNILTSDCDVIACATNSRLHLHTGLAKFINGAAGAQVEEDLCRQRERKTLKPGEIVCTRGGRLKCKHIIFICGSTTSDQRDALKQSFFNCFKYANDELKAEKIALPMIGAGHAGFPTERVITASKNALLQFDDEMSRSSRVHCLNAIHFYDITDHVLLALVVELSSLQSSHQESEPITKPSDKDEGSSSTNEPLSSSQPGGDNVGNDDKPVEQCPICMDPYLTEVKTLACGHKFHETCIDKQFRFYQPKCPICGALHEPLKGEVLAGQQMQTTVHNYDLKGYAGCGTIQINYNIPGGKTQDGNQYGPTRRVAYLPNNDEGKDIEDMLRRAFDAGLLFTVGESTTTGQKSAITWNDVHHKTAATGQFGYPDPGYLKRVREELAAKGITSSFRTDTGQGATSDSTNF